MGADRDILLGQREGVSSPVDRLDVELGTGFRRPKRDAADSLHR